MRSHDGCLFVSSLFHLVKCLPDASMSSLIAGFVFFKVDKIHLSFDNCIELETKVQHIFITPESSSCPNAINLLLLLPASGDS